MQVQPIVPPSMLLAYAEMAWTWSPRVARADATWCEFTSRSSAPATCTISCRTVTVSSCALNAIRSVVALCRKVPLAQPGVRRNYAVCFFRVNGFQDNFYFSQNIDLSPQILDMTSANPKSPPSLKCLNFCMIPFLMHCTYKAHSFTFTAPLWKSTGSTFLQWQVSNGLPIADSSLFRRFWKVGVYSSMRSLNVRILETASKLEFPFALPCTVTGRKNIFRLPRVAFPPK